MKNERRKTKEGRSKKMKNIIQSTGNKRYNTNSLSSNNNNINNTCNSKYKPNI